MKNLIRITSLLIIGILLFSTPVFSQETKVLSQTIRGKVVDKESQTIMLPVISYKIEF